MAKDIEKLIEEFVIPEMEYSPSYEKKAKGKKDKNAIKTVTIDEIPEVVLPKTKAERYEEAKGRLKQKTSAVSRRTKTPDEQSETAATVTLNPISKTLTLNPISKTLTRTVTKTLTRTGSTLERTALRKPPITSVKPVAEPVWVGSEDELVPFAWRLPLLPNIARPCKYYKQAVREAKEWLLPVPRADK
ncbi:MAG: hypothetical protein K2F90_03015 [Clostridiales bacterium]|nr:hypothetical protein [Clostridiales bacterium]